MKRGAILAGLAAILLASCGTDVDLGKRPQFTNGAATLTVLAYDAMTAAPLETATLKVRIGPNELTATRAGNAYTFTNLPAGPFPVFAAATGYLEFVGTTGALAQGAALANPAYTTSTLAMYPIGQVDNDITVKIFDAVTGAPATGGKVIVTMVATSLPTVIDQTFSAALVGGWGMKPSVTVKDNTNGVVTIEKANLVFGADYVVDIIGAKVGTKYLVAKYDTAGAAARTINPTTGYPQLNVFLAQAGATPLALTVNYDKQTFNGYTYNVGNRNAPNLVNSLIVTFATPVEVCHKVSSLGVTANTAEGDTPADHTPSPWVPTFTANNAATVTVSADGYTLTATPNFDSANPRDNEDDIEVTFTGIMIKVKDQPGDSTNPGSQCVALAGLTLRSAGTVSTKIDMQDRPASMN